MRPAKIWVAYMRPLQFKINMATIRKRGNKYFLDYRKDGKRVRQVIGTSRQEAEATLKKFQEQPTLLLSELFRGFLAFIQDSRSVSTAQRYASILNNFSAFINNNKSSLKYISSITPEDAQAFIQSRQEKGASTRTVNAELTVLRFMFRKAVAWEYIPVNPFAAVKNLPAFKSKTIRFLTQTEVSQLLGQCDDRLYPIIYTFLTTGLRKSELERLRWTDVDMDNRQIHVGQRSIPISDSLNQLFQEQMYRAKGSVYVFPHTDGGKLPSSRLYQDFKSLTQRAGLKDLTQLSVLRHTAAAQWMLQGAGMQTIKETLDYSISNALLMEQQLKTKGVDDIIEGVHF